MLAWLASRMISIFFRSYPPSSPEFLLRVSRVVIGEHAAFQAVLSNNVTRMKAAIKHSDCTPHDVDEYGNTLFAVRTILKPSHVEAIC